MHILDLCHVKVIYSLFKILKVEEHLHIRIRNLIYSTIVFVPVSRQIFNGSDGKLYTDSIAP